MSEVLYTVCDQCSKRVKDPYLWIVIKAFEIILKYGNKHWYELHFCTPACAANYFKEAIKGIKVQK